MVKKSLTESPESGVVIQNINIRPTVRQSQDIGKWRSALQSAESIVPIRVPLYDLYDELELDGLLTHLMSKRILNVTRRKLRLVNSAGDDIPALEDLLKSSAFRELRKCLRTQTFYGTRVVELMREKDQLKIYAVPVKHVRPKEGVAVKEQYDLQGTPYREAPASNYIVEVGSWNNLGLLLKCAPYVIYKRGGFGDWARFAEIFGMPFREARYDGYNQTVRAQLEEALERAGSAPYIVLPKEAEMTFHEAKNATANGELYNTLRKACNEELAITILGQSSTTITEAGRLGNNDSQEQTEDDIQADDLEDELAIFNEKVIPVLANLGYPVKGASFVHEEVDDKLTLKDRVDIAHQLKNMGTPIGDDYMYELTGIPKPDDYEAQRAAKEAEKEAQKAELPTKGAKGALPVGVPTNRKTKLKLFERLLSFFG